MENEEEKIEATDNVANEATETQDEAKSVSVKEISKWAMLFASVWIGALTILNALQFIKFQIEMKDIIVSAMAIVGVWSPTYVSMWLDKIKEMKK